MVWRQIMPEKPGWYWYKNPKLKDGGEPQILQVRNYAGDLAVGNCRIKGFPRLEDAFWAGPILPPVHDR